MWHVNCEGKHWMNTYMAMLNKSMQVDSEAAVKGGLGTTMFIRQLNNVYQALWTNISSHFCLLKDHYVLTVFVTFAEWHILGWWLILMKMWSCWLFNYHWKHWRLPNEHLLPPSVTIIYMQSAWQHFEDRECILSEKKVWTSAIWFTYA